LGLNLAKEAGVVAEVAKQVAGAQAIVMAENRGMPVADMTKLRAQARASGVYFRVVKNTLVRRASRYAVRPLAEKMVGPLAYGIGPDPVRRGEGPERLRQGQRQVRDHGRCDAGPDDVRQGRSPRSPRCRRAKF
jgi:ribosomal protein L10